MVEQDCVKFSRETERREQAGTNVWHPISTHLALIAAGHLLPLIIWGLYKHTHTHTVCQYPITLFISVSSSLSQTQKSFLYFHTLAGKSWGLPITVLSSLLDYEHTHSPSEQHMLTMISSDVCCADSSALASRNSSLSLLKPTDTHNTTEVIVWVICTHTVMVKL